MTLAAEVLLIPSPTVYASAAPAACSPVTPTAVPEALFPSTQSLSGMLSHNGADTHFPDNPPYNFLPSADDISHHRIYVTYRVLQQTQLPRHHIEASALPLHIQNNSPAAIQMPTAVTSIL